MTCEKCGVETNQFRYSKIENGKYGYGLIVCRVCRFWESLGELVVAGAIFALLFAMLLI